MGPRSAVILRLIVLQNYRIQHLDLRENSLGDEGMKAIASLVQGSKSLVHLDVTATKITTEGAATIITAVGKSQSLTCFIMGNTTGPTRNLVKPVAFQACEGALARSRILSILELSGNFVGSESLSAVARGLRQNRALVSLNLSQCSLDRGCTDAIMESLKFGKLRYLDLSRNKLESKVGLRDNSRSSPSDLQNTSRRTDAVWLR